MQVSALISGASDIEIPPPQDEHERHAREGRRRVGREAHAVPGRKPGRQKSIARAAAQAAMIAAMKHYIGTERALREVDRSGW
jgi:hypothetical protein